jgi:APA family basic amino acid/polyamine antiporter
MNGEIPKTPVRLEQVIGRWTLLGLIINAVIGAGVFGLPSSIAGDVGTWAPMAYLLGALVSLVFVSVVVELSSQFAQPGGAYLYSREAFGVAWGTQVGWFSWLARVTTAAAVVNLLLSYLGEFFPGLMEMNVRRLTGIVVLGALCLLSYYSVRWSSRISNLFALVKVGSLLCFAAVCIFRYKGESASTAGESFPAIGGWVDALIAMIFAYSGFESAMIPGSELKNPRRDTPFAAFTALALIAVLYMTVHSVVMYVVPNLATTERPLSAAASEVAGLSAGKAVSIAVIISTLGWLSSAALTAPRLTFAMGTQGDLPSYFGKVHRQFKTPSLAIMLWAILVTVLICIGDFRWNVVLSVAARLIVYGSMCASAIALRIRFPDRDAWRAPGGIALPVVGMAICLLLASRLQLEHFIALAAVSFVASMCRILPRSCLVRPQGR